MIDHVVHVHAKFFDIVDAAGAAFYEIRRDTTFPGRRDELVRVMEDTFIPFVRSRGMSVTASFVDEEDPDGYVWVRRFDTEANRVAQYAAVSEDEQWEDEIAPVVLSVTDREKAVVIRAVPTPHFPLA